MSAQDPSAPLRAVAKLITVGFESDSVVRAVEAGDMSLLIHTGYVWTPPASSTINLDLRARCVYCHKRGPGMTRLATGEFVHRWPCRDRMEGV